MFSSTNRINLQSGFRLKSTLSTRYVLLLYRVITIAPIIAFLKQKHKQPFLIVLVGITKSLL
jgi:hypothetical protein